ncbi:MAG: histidine kinase [Melioribacteraceae bacterium]|nr:histidine kinase [Melioribacteraceae bacterium]
MKNPLIENNTNIFALLTVWAIIVFNHTLVLNFLFNVRIENSLLDAAIYNFLFLLLSVSLWYPSIYLSIEKSKMWKTLLNHLAGGIFTSVIWVYTGYFILSNTIKTDAYLSFLDKSLVWRFNIGIIYYVIIVVFYYFTYYYKSYKEKSLVENELKSLVKDAELKTLKYQINPHFVFNSLNSINSLTLSDPAKAREMTIKLSSFLRKTLSYNETQVASMLEEIENVKLYMDIEKIRFEENIEFVTEISEQCLKMKVPIMILQPIVENAIKHGVYESTEKITIKLTCRRDDRYVIITMQNNFDPQGVSRKGEGIGLQNIKHRLSIIYGQDNLLTFNKLENIFTVNIYIPVQ